jgi:hypothetical protein
MFFRFPPDARRNPDRNAFEFWHRVVTHFENLIS